VAHHSSKEQAGVVKDFPAWKILQLYFGEETPESAVGALEKRRAGEKRRSTTNNEKGTGAQYCPLFIIRTPLFERLRLKVTRSIGSKKQTNKTARSNSFTGGIHV
jgi:hypothetical protein